jgi:fermentation-respiration switch protein FrsA (DUF1100 family)
VYVSIILNSQNIFFDVASQAAICHAPRALSLLVAQARDDCGRAARLFGAGEALRDAVGASVLPFYRKDYECGVEAVRKGLGEAALRANWEEGRTMTLDEAIRCALAESV